VLARSAAALLCCALFAAAQDSGEITGSVINSATGTGVSGVAVKVFTQLGSRPDETSTDAQGQFSIRALKPGEYSSSFDHEGFAPLETGMGGSLKRLHVDGKTTARLDVELIPFGRISGRVVDADGKPVAEAVVTLDGPPASRTPAVTTGTEGTYSFDKLRPGSYMILAKPKAPATPGDKRADRVESVLTYFPSAMERRQAAPIILRAGADAAGNEIRLRTVPVYRLSGVVLTEAGRPASGAIVSLRSRNSATPDLATTMMGEARTWFPGPGIGVEAANTQTGADGTFEFTSVPEGDWIIHAETPWDYIEETKRDIQAIGDVNLSVSRKDTADVQIRLATNFDLALSIEFDDPSTVAQRGDLMLVMSPVDGGPEIFGLPGKNGKLVVDRAYAGRYTVQAQTHRPGFYVSSIDYAGRAVSGPIDIASGAQPLHIVLRKHAGVVRGAIEKGDAATVLLAPSAAGDALIVYGVPCGPGGSFQFDNLRPGSYAVVAFDHVDDRKLSDPAAVADLLKSAQAITVQEDANPPLTLSVNRWPD
jgi:hypothetical protein